MPNNLTIEEVVKHIIANDESCKHSVTYVADYQHISSTAKQYGSCTLLFQYDWATRYDCLCKKIYETTEAIFGKPVIVYAYTEHLRYDIKRHTQGD